jgi:hypothetical protein
MEGEMEERVFSKMPVAEEGHQMSDKEEYF